MIGIVAAAYLAAADPATPSLAEAAHAIEAGRLVQAREMVSRAIAAGERGPDMDRLLADLAFADRRWSEAQVRYTALAAGRSDDVRSEERAGIAAINAQDVKSARHFVDRATSSGGATWRAWNALGVLCDLDQDWDCADGAYATADELAPHQAEVLNNHGWSLILRGEWASAAQLLERAAQADPSSPRIANNLELARTAVSADLPRRREGESHSDYAARLNDAGVAAEMRGDRDRAIAAFSRALATKRSWYDRAANNLEVLQAK